MSSAARSSSLLKTVMTMMLVMVVAEKGFYGIFHSSLTCYTQHGIGKGSKLCIAPSA